ncbi:hypothetical protein B0H65DRAFT_425687 [Neurospora tetraspora]|uniref:Uncharacterized protein n=1 Tax=Neurospora tetraspora TaxID=94610 RepID=A0AAE0JG18_9PEZI|nr:hypothetical protein B0H65DRAFT_425687 [Neurospora tetraspora]
MPTPTMPTMPTMVGRRSRSGSGVSLHGSVGGGGGGGLRRRAGSGASRVSATSAGGRRSRAGSVASGGGRRSRAGSVAGTSVGSSGSDDNCCGLMDNEKNKKNKGKITIPVGRRKRSRSVVKGKMKQQQGGSAGGGSSSEGAKEREEKVRKSGGSHHQFHRLKLLLERESVQRKLMLEREMSLQRKIDANPDFSYMT